MGSWRHGQAIITAAHAGERPASVSQDVQRLPLHNPATQQMLILGKRREAAEAKLEQRLRAENPQ